MKNQLKNFILLGFILIISQSYPTCQSIQIYGYKYQLSALPHSFLFTVQNTLSSFVDFALCQPVTCNNVSSFVFLKQSDKCIPYTNALNPMGQNYSMIDQNAPKKGIKVNYLPYYDSTNHIYRTVTLNIYCPTVFASSNSCKKINQPTTNSSIECNFSSEAGCASIKLNYFWQFLSDKAIIFAILLWIIALFELLFGYLAIRMTIFIFGILSGAIFGIIYTAQNYVNFIYESQGYGIAVFVICLSVLMGVLFGIALLTLPRLGYVNIGLWVAFIFSLLLQNSVLYLTGGLLAFYITVGVVGFIMAAIALMKLKNYIILSTSFISAFWLVRPLGFFLPYYPNQFLSGNSYLLNGSTNWQFYLYLISIIILTILGAVFQFCCFKKSASGNEAYYLEEQGSLKEKFKKLLEFQQVRHFIRTGADELRFFKQLIIDESQAQEHQTHHKNKKSVHQSEEDDKSIGDDFSQDQKPSTRKKTKIQKQLQDYNAKRTKKQDQKKKQALFPTKPKPKPQQQQKRNRKVVEVPVQQQDQQSNSKKSQDQQSQDVKPNKLTNYKRQGR